jgi:hypothetical protein
MFVRNIKKLFASSKVGSSDKTSNLFYRGVGFDSPSGHNYLDWDIPWYLLVPLGKWYHYHFLPHNSQIHDSLLYVDSFGITQYRVTLNNTRFESNASACHCLYDLGQAFVLGQFSGQSTDTLQWVANALSHIWDTHVYVYNWINYMSSRFSWL